VELCRYDTNSLIVYTSALAIAPLKGHGNYCLYEMTKVNEIIELDNLPHQNLDLPQFTLKAVEIIELDNLTHVKFTLHQFIL